MRSKKIILTVKSKCLFGIFAKLNIFVNSELKFEKKMSQKIHSCVPISKLYD